MKQRQEYWAAEYNTAREYLRSRGVDERNADRLAEKHANKRTAEAAVSGKFAKTRKDKR